MHDLVGEARDQQSDFVAAEGVHRRGRGLQRLAAPVRLRPVGRRQRRGQHVLQLAHVALGLAAFAVMGQHLVAQLHCPLQRGDEEEALQQQIAFAFLDDEDDPSRPVPAVGLIAQLAQPGPGLHRSAPHRADHVGLGQPVQHRVGAQPRDVIDTPGLQTRQQCGRGEPCVDAHHGDVAETLARPVDDVEDHIERALCGADIARPQPGVQHVARLGDGGDQRVVDPGIVMAIPLRLRLVAVDLDGCAVDIECDGRHPFALTLGPDPAPRHLQHRLAQDLDIRRFRQDRGEARQRRLRGEPWPLQRRQPGRRTGGQTEGRIVAQRVGIVVVAPALCRQKHARADEGGEVVGHVHLAARILQAGSHPAKDTTSFQDLAHKHSTGITGQSLHTALDTKRPIEAARDRL